MKLLRNTATKISKNEDGVNVTHLQNSKAVLVHGNVVNNDYQHESRVLYKIVPNISFDQLLGISPKTFVLLKTFN